MSKKKRKERPERRVLTVTLWDAPTTDKTIAALAITALICALIVFAWLLWRVTS